MKRLERAWYRNAGWLVLLSPLGWLFGLLSVYRRNQFQRGNRAVIKAPVPVIVVGNITTGGTGKTPLVIALVKFLREQGYRPGVVSRGYGAGSARFPQWVTPTTPVGKSGDEPLLIARHTGAPVVIDPDRPRAIKALLESNDCNLIISDDGLQHYAMGRDVEIVVVDGARGLANGRLLPAGPLREKPQRLREADFVIINGEPRSGLLAALRAWNNRVSQMQLQPQRLIRLSDGESRAFQPSEPPASVHAVAGIGNPQRFFDSLQGAGFAIMPHVFPDHHRFSGADLDFDAPGQILMTEKDAVKCSGFAPSDSWYLEVEATLPDDFLEALLKRLKRRGGR